MIGYKSLKGKSKVAVKKVKVVDQEAVKEITDENGNIVREAKAEESHDALQLGITKRFDSATGEALEDNVQEMSISSLEMEIKSLKDKKDFEAARIDDQVADLEALLPLILRNYNNKPTEGI